MLKIYHPFINGPNGDYVKQMLMEYPDVRINIPPLSVMKDEISVAGEKNGVLAVVEKIKEINKVLVITVLCIDNDVCLNSMMTIKFIRIFN